MSIIGLDGKLKTVAEASVDPKDLVTALKDMISEIESGTMKAERWYLLVECTSQKNAGDVMLITRDSGLMICEANFMLDTAKFNLLHKSFR